MFSEKNVSFIYFILALFSKIAHYLNRLGWALKWRHCRQKICDSLNFVEKYVRLKWKTKVNVIITIIIENGWMCLNKQGSGLDFRPRDIKMIKFWIWLSSHYATQYCEYATIYLDRVLNISWVLKIQDSEYGKVLIYRSYTGF